MPPPLEQPRAGGGVVHGRDVENTGGDLRRKCARISEDDEKHTFARSASLRATDYDAWLKESKAGWRFVRKKLLLVRNFCELEGDGHDVDIDLLGPSNELFSQKKGRKKGQSATRWTAVKAEDVKLGDVPSLQWSFKKLLAMAMTKEKKKAKASTGGVDNSGERFPERENLEDSEVDSSEYDSDFDSSTDGEAGLGSSSDDDEIGEVRRNGETDDTTVRTETTQHTEPAAPPPTRAPPTPSDLVEPGSAAHALSAYGDAPLPSPMSQSLPQSASTYAPPLGGASLGSNTRNAQALATAAMPPPPSQVPQRDPTRGALSALAAYGFEVTPMSAVVPAPEGNPGPDPGNPGPSPGNPNKNNQNPGVPLNLFENPWSAAQHPHYVDLNVGSNKTKVRKPFVMDEQLRVARALSLKKWSDLSLQDVTVLLKQVKYLISRRRKAHLGGREEGTALENRRQREEDGFLGSGGGDAIAGAWQKITEPPPPPPLVLPPNPTQADEFCRLVNPKTHKCVACDRVFDMPFKLADHMFEHAGTTPHVCPHEGTYCISSQIIRQSVFPYKTDISFIYLRMRSFVREPPDPFEAQKNARKKARVSRPGVRQNLANRARVGEPRTDTQHRPAFRVYVPEVRQRVQTRTEPSHTRARAHGGEAVYVRRKRVVVFAGRAGVRQEVRVQNRFEKTQGGVQGRVRDDRGWDGGC